MATLGSIYGATLTALRGEGFHLSSSPKPMELVRSIVVKVSTRNNPN